MIEKINVLFESEDDANLFRESLEEFRLNKRIGHIYKVNLAYDESGKKKFNCEIYKVADDLVEDIEALIKRFNGKRSYPSIL